MGHDAAIGVFDSGVGGLTVAKAIMAALPKERIIYFGDTARVPYGGKSRETVTKYTEQIIRFLLTKEVKALVIACNTMSALALDTVEKNLSIPIIGVVKPGALAASKVTKNKRIGVIATESTISSGLYVHYIGQIDPEIEVLGKACPLFCPLVEEGMLSDPVTTEMAKRYLDGLIHQDIDTLILGCTHYPLLTETIAEVVGKQVTLVNPAYETAKELKELLKSEALLAQQPENASHSFYVSDSVEKFQSFAARILHLDAVSAENIHIEEY
ncbi:MAG: glutamate racemase [Lachnospiraceae bacterium]|nr:glutamate racemase [Lachnospiraceae bacterium]